MFVLGCKRVCVSVYCVSVAMCQCVCKYMCVLICVSSCCIVVNLSVCECDKMSVCQRAGECVSVLVCLCDIVSVLFCLCFFWRVSAFVRKCVSV